MVSKIIFRLALITGIAAFAYAGANLVMAPASTSTTGYALETAEEVEIPLDAFISRTPRHGLDAFDSTTIISDMETSTGWTTTDYTLVGTPYWQSAAVPFGDPNAPALWCGDAAVTDNLVAPGGYLNHQQHYLESPTLDLSGSSAPITLAFKARWKLEAPGGEPVPFNMWDVWNVQVSTDGGNTWTIPAGSDVSLPYTGTCAFAYDDWCFEGCYAGWGGVANAGAYTVMTVNLNAYAGQSNVRFRYGLLSDPGFSAEDDSSYFGLIVDSIRVTNSSSTLLANDGDNTTGWTIEALPVAPVGDTWAFSDSSAPTGMLAIPDQVNAWHASHGGLALIENALISPPITLPDTALPGQGGPGAWQRLRLGYYVWADLLDSDGDDDNSLEDLYEIYVSTDDGVTWTRIAYDYGTTALTGDVHPDAGNSLLGWVGRTRGLQTGGVSGDIDLTPYGEQTIRLQFRLQTDCNNDGGTGSGLYIDYPFFIATRAFATDAATRNMIVPFPVTVGLARTWSFDYVNAGANTIGNALRYRQLYTRPTGVNQGTDSLKQATGTLTTNQFLTVPATWTPDVAGSYRIRVYSSYLGEQDRSNDTTRSPINVPLNSRYNMAVDVQPTGIYELGYHLRDYTSVLSNPRLVRYGAAADGVPAADADTLDINKLQIMWNWDPADINSLPDHTGRARINFYGQGPDNRTPGALLYTYEEEIDTNETVSPYGGDSLLNRWWEKDLSAVAQLKRMQGDFWVEIMALDTVLGAGLPGLLAMVTDPQDTTDTHNYTRRLDIAGQPILASPSRFCVEVTTGPSVWPDPVTNLTIARDGLTNDIKLDWSAPLRADGYLVYRSTDINVPLQTLLTATPIAPTDYTDAGILTTGSFFYYTVVAVNQ